jgi:hypothetical protein
MFTADGKYFVDETIRLLQEAAGRYDDTTAFEEFIDTLDLDGDT